MSETRIAARWIKATLAAASGLSGVPIWDTSVPQGGSFPAVVVAFNAGMDVYAQGAPRILLDCYYDVRAIGQTDNEDDIEPLADAIDAALQDASGTASGGAVLWCQREAPLDYPTTEGGQEFRHMGGHYHLASQAL